MRTGAWFIVGAFALLPLTAAQAEIYKCAGPDGRTLYTTDATQCRDAAAPHALKGQIQRSDARSPAATRRASPPAASARGEAAAASWAAKKAAAERAVLEAQENVDVGVQLVTACNRGAVVRVDDENGIPKALSCDKIKTRFAEAERVLVERRRYVEEGLAEDCRRAGCLPGWIR